MLAHVFHPHLAAGGRGMHEAVVAKIDADVRETAPQGIEEHEIARLQFVAMDRLADLADVARGARQYQAEALPEDMAHQAAAVEAGLGRLAAAPIMHADEGEGAHDKFLRVRGIAIQQGRGLIAGFFRSSGGRSDQQTENDGNMSQIHGLEYSRRSAHCKGHHMFLLEEKMACF
jgi:hypothetical protein